LTTFFGILVFDTLRGSHLQISQTSSLERHSPNSLSSMTSRAETNIPGLAGERDDFFEIAEDSAEMLQPFATPCDHYGTLPCIDEEVGSAVSRYAGAFLGSNT
jgi:hypothetical protein